MGALNDSSATPREPIAIVGIGCRLPGGADSPERLWQLLCEGFDAIGPMPPERFDVEALYDERPATPGKIMTRWGGFLSAIEQFDAAFFGIAPREAERLDPQQRLLLETAWEALADAGTPAARLAGSNTGVFVGMWLNEFESRLFANPAEIDFYMTTGSGRYTASGRISYFLDLLGPSITIDTACSSSLVAVHLACQSIWSGECDLALAGGANVILEPHITIAYSQSRMMAPDGRCKFGDASADGYVRSDGAAMVALKPLSAALAAGDPVYALIRGSAVTNDGRSSGFLATPGQAGQEEMLRRAYASAGVDPRSVQYIEAHGTGTAAGDPVELGALGAVLGVERPAERPCLVGSLKTNVGHTEGAAGVAGMIKVALALKNAQLPASLHLHQPNPNIPWRELGLEVCARLQPWPAGDGPALAGVSSFGIAGTNAHVVLEAAPAPATESTAQHGPLVLPISAHTPAARAELAQRFHELLARTDAPSAYDICYTAAARRSHLDERLAVVGRTREELAAGLAAFLRGEAHAGVATGTAGDVPRMVFVFPGQGTQWLGMARELLRDEPVFRTAIEHCEQAMAPYVSWSLLEQLTSPDARLDDIDVVQPTLFAIQVALAALWRSWGVEPDAVVGHSMGEVAAACVAGALSLDDAARVICVRSRLLRRVRGQGAMAVVSLSADLARAAIAGLDDRLSVAVSNSPQSTVLAGDPLALETVLQQLRARDVFCRLVKVDVASHSPQMDPLLDELAAELAGLQPQEASVLMCSSVSAVLLSGAQTRSTLGAEYWTRNLRQPVRFAEAIEQLGSRGYLTFIELSPHPGLIGPIEATLQHHGRQGRALPSMLREAGELHSMLGSLGALYTLGATPAWQALFPSAKSTVRLPAYPWQRQRFWPSQHAARPASTTAAGTTLLGSRLPEVALLPGVSLWSGALNPASVSSDQRSTLAGVELLSAGVYAALALEAAAMDGAQVCLRGLTISSDLLLTAADPRATQVAISRRDSSAELRIYSRIGDQQPWIEHAHAGVESYTDGQPLFVDVQTVKRACTADVQPDAVGDTALIGAGEALARLGPIHDTTGSHFAAGLRLLERLTASSGERAVSHIERVVRHSADVPVWAYARLGDGGTNRPAVLLLDESGQIVAELLGVRFDVPRPEMLERLAQARSSEWLYELDWQPLAYAAPAPVAPQLLLFAGDESLADELARRVAERGGRTTLARAGTTFAREKDGSVVIDPGNPEDYRRLLAEAGSLDGVVYLASVEQAALESSSGEQVLEQQRDMISGALGLAQALVASGGPRLWLVTQGAIGRGAERVAVEQATLWGLGRVIANEHPEHWGGLIDIEPGADAKATRLLDALLADDGEDQVMLRGDARLGARLVRAKAAPGTPAPLRRDATYLITGGLGGVGLVLARWMLANGARNLALLGRRTLDAAGADAIAELESGGARVMYVSADVSQAASLAEALAKIARQLPPLKGVVHTAGVLDDAALRGQSWAGFERVMQSKVAGAWNLHTQTVQLDLDLFVLCSSISALIGTPGQANYAAANAFLDALAQARHAAGLAALSINWGHWGEVGLATQDGRDEQLSRRGVLAMPPADAAAAFGALRAYPQAQATVAAIDWRVLTSWLARGAATPLAREFAAEHAASAPDANASQPDLPALLDQTPEPERLAVCLAYVQSMVAGILRFEHHEQVIPDRGFFQIGMDSLTAVELRTQLSRGLGRTLSATLAFDYPTATRLSHYLLGEMFPAVAAPQAQPGLEDAELKEIEQLTRDDIHALLDAELDAIDL